MVVYLSIEGEEFEGESFVFRDVEEDESVLYQGQLSCVLVGVFQHMNRCCLLHGGGVLLWVFGLRGR